MILSNEWKDYELLDMSNGEKLERWGKYILIRPDPQIIWKDKTNSNLWKSADAHYHRSNKGGGSWEFNNNIPNKWEIGYKNLKFNISLMGFKHTGLFPEQAINWEFMINKIKEEKKNREKINILNLFAYTGGATVACSYAGANVVHVDSSKGMVTYAKENIDSSKLTNNKVRYIVDDVIKFVEREIRRGNKYDGIVMDPPSYGRGTNGEVWQIEDNLFSLVELCTNILSDKPIFFLINSYTTGLSPTVLNNLLNISLKKYNGKVSSGEVGLPMKDSKLILPCGIYGRWEC